MRERVKREICISEIHTYFFCFFLIILQGFANLFLSPVFSQTLANITGATIELYNTDGSVGAARYMWVRRGYSNCCVLLRKGRDVVVVFYYLLPLSLLMLIVVVIAEVLALVLGFIRPPVRPLQH
jgi:hypothetical protein